MADTLHITMWLHVWVEQIINNNARREKGVWLPREKEAASDDNYYFHTLAKPLAVKTSGQWLGRVTGYKKYLKRAITRL